MEVILQEDFPALGYVGDKLNVKPGYARNFLIPRGIAVEALSHNARLLTHRMAGIIAKRARLKAQAEELSKNIGKVCLEFKLKLGEQGKAFGAITAKDIESGLKEKGFNVDRRQVKFSEQLRKAGVYTVQVKLHAEVLTGIQVTVLSDAPEGRSRIAEPDDDQAGEGNPKKRGGRGKKQAFDASAPTEASVSSEGSESKEAQQAPTKRSKKVAKES